MSRPSVHHTPAALCLFVIALCLQVSYAVSESSTQAVLSRKVVSAGFTARRLLQDAEMNVASSDEELLQQPEGLTEVLSQSDKTDLPSEDVSEATTSADQLGMDQSGESESQIAELNTGLSEDTDIPEAESGNDDLDRVSLAEVESENPFLVQSIEHGQDEEAPSSAQQSTDQETFSPQHAGSGSDSQNDKLQDDDLTFDEALAQAASGKDLSDESVSTDSSNSTADLTFAEAVAATKGTESVSDVIANKTQASTSDSDNPTAETPVLESLLPSVESANGSLSAAISEPDPANSGNASSSSTSSSDELSSLVGTAAGAAGQKLSEAADASESLLDKDTSSIQVDSSAVNTTRDFVSGAASSAAGAVTAASSAASGLLSNVTDAVSNTAKSSAATGAASAASDLLSNATSAISSTANSSAVAGAVTATSSLLNNATTALTTPVNASSLNGTGSAAGGAETDSLLPADMLNSTVLNSSVADGVIHSSLQKVGGVLSGVRSWLNSSGSQQDADDEYTTTTSASSANQTARNGAKAGQMQEPLTDLEQLEPEEEADLEFANAGLMDAASTTGALGHSSSSTAAGSRPAHSSGQSRPAAQRPARPSAQGTAGTALANATDAATSHRAAAAELGTESGTALSAQAAGKAAGHPANRQQQLPRMAGQQVLDSEEGFQSSAVTPRTGATDTSSSRSSSGGAQGAVSAARPGKDSAAAGSVSGESVLGGGVRANNSSTAAVVAAAMANPKSSASTSARAAGMNSMVADEDDDQVGSASQTRPNAAGAQSKSGAASSALAAQRLRQQQEEAQEEEYLQRQAKPVSASKAVRPTNVSQQPRPVSGTNAAQSASSGRLGAVDSDEYLDGELAELGEEYDQVVDPTSRTAQAQAQAKGSSMGKAVDAGRGASSASERASQGGTSSRPGLQATVSAQTGSDYDDDYADEIVASQAGRVSSAGTAASTAAQLANSKAQQSLAGSGLDDDALLEDDSLGGVQGSGSSTGTQLVPNRQSSTSAKTGSQQSRLPSGRQGAVIQDEADSLGSNWPRSGASGTTPAGKSASGSSGRAGTAAGSSNQVGTSHQLGQGQTRDAQLSAFGTAGKAAATDLASQHVGAASAEEEETLMQPLGQTAATHSSQSNSARAGSRNQPTALPSSRSASIGSDLLSTVNSGSGSAASSASGTRTPAQQRELEREMAFKASTGSGAHDLMDSKSAVSGGLGSLGDRGAALGQSWSALPNQNRGTSAGGASSSSRTGAAGSSQSANSRQQPLGDGESEADIGDYDSRAFGSDSSSSSTGGSGQSAYPRLVASDTLGTDSRSFAAGSKGGVAASSRSGTALGDDLADSNSFGFGTGATTKTTSRSRDDLADKSSFGAGSGTGSTTKTTSGFGDDVADSRSFGGGAGSGSTTKSTSGFEDDLRDGSSNSRVRSGFGDADDARDSSSFMVGRDPTNPMSVVGAQQGFTGQPHAVQQRTSAGNAGSNAMGGLPAGKTQMSLDADEDEEAPLSTGSQAASQALSKMNGADVDKSGGGLAGPIVTGSSDDEYVARPQAGARQSSDTSSTLHSLLDSVINNWVVITALSVFACTGAVLAFVFLRGFVPNPYDVITFSNVGTAGYAGNSGGYTGVSREDEENGWENGWGDDDAQVVSPQQKQSSSNSPPRGTGVGKLKKGTFAKKKPANWSNDF